MTGSLLHTIFLIDSHPRNLTDLRPELLPSMELGSAQIRPLLGRISCRPGCSLLDLPRGGHLRLGFPVPSR
ncbi:hypothetical protein PAHAL_5G356400 [Panicum hallii]|uniref:Uncharacterized protein n=1 Tax=Panicum hallii TaxID=206008 RepID=A0A2T8IM99_9POAL|nr:hypothetical protein PAHAL_5G356400 [Panicum hallii]